MDLLENCETCYPFILSEFPETIVIEGHLDPLLQYYFKVTDKFLNSYVTELLTPDGLGIVTIQVQTVGLTPTDFVNEPSEAWFNKNAGKFTIEASLTKDIWEPVDLIFLTTPYDTYTCIVVEFVNDDSEKNTVL